MHTNEIYITDLDHTFLRSDLTLSDFSVETWNQKAQKQTMGIATARSFTKSQELLKQLKLNAPMILLDGSIVVTPEKKIITMNTFDKEIGDEVVEIGLKHGIDPFIIGMEEQRLHEIFLYPRTLNEHQKEVLKGYKNDPRLQFNPNNRTMEQNLKIVYFGDYQQLNALNEELELVFYNEIERKLSPEKYGGGWFLTILHPEGDKSHALQKVAEYLNRDLEDVTVFGDSVNDIGMFKLAGTAVAVHNALNEVKAAADILSPYTNDEDAVARYLLNE